MKLTTLSVLVSVALFGLVGCASKGSGSETRSAHNNGNVSLTRPSPQPNTNTAVNNPINAKPNNNTNVNGNNNVNTNTHATVNATAHTIALNDSKAMNITYVARPTTELAKEIQEAVKLTNQLRTKKGLEPLKYDEKLSAFAQMRASEFEIALLRYESSATRKTSLMHQRIDGRAFHEGSVIGNGYVGENVYYGTRAGNYHTANSAVRWWQNSPPHYAAITNPQYNRIGIGVVYIPNSKYGYYWVQIFGSGTASFPYEFAKQDNPKPLEQLIVNSTTVPLPKAQSGTWQAVNANGHTGWVNGYQHSRFGSVGKGNTQTHLFYQGARTDDTAIPKSGKATYNGHALIMKNGTANTNAQSRFTADFGTRKLNGTIHQNNQTLYTLSADINGGAFASKAGASVETQGAFFGQNAEELGGTFKDSKTDTKGVFGAKK